MNGPDEKTIMDFWYEYDDFFLYHPPEDVSSAMQELDPYGRLLDLFHYHVRNGTVETDFKTSVQKDKEAIRILSSNVLRIIQKYFDNNMELQQKAFELFAQGILFDNGNDENGRPRREPGDKIHMMDSKVAGYVVWHAFIRSILLLELDVNKDAWLRMDRHVGLAAAILAELIKKGKDPQQSDDPNLNKSIDDTLLNELRKVWLVFSSQDIDSKITQLQQQIISKHAT